MGTIVIGWDSAEEGALARRMAVRPRHLDVIQAWARDGRLACAGPLLKGWGGDPAGSVMILSDQASAEAYLREEPFSAEGVWVRREARPYRIAPLPYRPLPGSDGGGKDPILGTFILAMDGKDAEAEQRRLAVRPRHFQRVPPEAEAGRLLIGGAILDDSGRMIGSALVLALSEEPARAWVAEDPYSKDGVWQDVSFHPFRLFPLPYHPLPRP